MYINGQQSKIPLFTDYDIPVLKQGANSANLLNNSIFNQSINKSHQSQGLSNSAPANISTQLVNLHKLIQLMQKQKSNPSTTKTDSQNIAKSVESQMTAQKAAQIIDDNFSMFDAASKSKLGIISRSDIQAMANDTSAKHTQQREAAQYFLANLDDLGAAEIANKGGTIPDGAITHADLHAYIQQQKSSNTTKTTTNTTCPKPTTSTTPTTPIKPATTVNTAPSTPKPTIIPTGSRTGSSTSDSLGYDKVIYSNDFTNRVYSQNSWEMQNPGGLSLVNDPSNPGNNVMKADLRDTDAMAASGTRAEIYTPKAAQFKLGEEYNISWRMQVPADYQNDRQGEIVQQIHDGGDGPNANGPPPAGITMKNGNYYLFSCTRGSDGEQKTETLLGSIDADKGVWVDWDIRYKPGYGDGYIEVYKNGELVGTKEGNTAYEGDQTSYAKFGIYKYQWNGDNTTDVSHRTMLYDDIEITQK